MDRSLVGSCGSVLVAVGWRCGLVAMVSLLWVGCCERSRSAGATVSGCYGQMDRVVLREAYSSGRGGNLTLKPPSLYTGRYQLSSDCED